MDSVAFGRRAIRTLGRSAQPKQLARFYLVLSEHRDDPGNSGREARPGIGPIAQLAERTPDKGEVGSSNLPRPTTPTADDSSGV